MPLNFVTDLPEPAKPGGMGRVQQIIADLADNPGAWAEIAFYPKGKQSTASARGKYMSGQDKRVETAVRTVDGKVVLFARVVESWDDSYAQTQMADDMVLAEIRRYQRWTA